MNKAKRKKQKIRVKYFKSVFSREKWVLAAVSIVLMLILLKFARYLTDESQQTPLKTLKPAKIINATQTISWSGNDTALVHTLGSEGLDGAWTCWGDGYGYLISGPYVNLGPGSYRVLFEMKAEGVINDSQLVGSIEVTENKGSRLLEKELYGRDFGNDGKFKDFSLPLLSGKILKDVEFRVHYPNSGVNISVKKITLTSGSMAWTGSDPSLNHDIGREGVAGTWTSGTGVGGYMVSGGPHVNLAPGIYDIYYTFVVDKKYADESKHIATMEVSYNGGQVIPLWSDGKLIGKDFNTGRASDVAVYKAFINSIVVDNTLNDVEFRLYYVNNTNEVVLKDIHLLIR